MPEVYGVRAPREMYKKFLEALSDAVALDGGLLRPYVVPSANDPALGKPIIGGTRTGHRHARHDRIQAGS
jgi:hypothetical protein